MKVKDVVIGVSVKVNMLVPLLVLQKLRSSGEWFRV